MTAVMHRGNGSDGTDAAAAPRDGGDADAALSVTTEPGPTHTLVRVAGAVDAAHAAQFDGALRAAEQDALALVLDLRRVDLSSSAGISVLLAFEARARRAGFGAAIVRADREKRPHSTAFELVGRVRGSALARAVAGVVAEPVAAAA